MKNITALATIMMIAGISHAHAFDAHIYANTITTHNITTLQHTITNTAFGSFGGSMATTLSKTATLAPQSSKAPNNNAKIYGSAPIYGEYNDDGSAGRSGGDRYNSDATLTGMWFNWQHASENTKFDSFERLDTKFDNAMFGVSGGQTKLWNGTSKWGIYAGYIDGHQQNSNIDISEQGGYVGIYNGNKFGNLNVYTTINGGVIDNSADTILGTDEYTNMWVGGAVKTTYSFALDDTFSIIPGLHIGYTWVKGENYTAASGDILNNDAFSAFEITPSIRAVKHIGNGWHGALSSAYIITTNNGGDISVNNIDVDNLAMGNFIEYSISLEKSVAQFTFTANIGRRDGARDGWIGGMNIKYAF
ncbi:MAG: autotransporter outer membrane beta-barrel domain-containing protein [Alphaproteobacteria bacterium]|nr:autotransporter outer membrane beta-barrel domain-containing protein [Alphaproteobacteria bacterium]